MKNLTLILTFLFSQYLASGQTNEQGYSFHIEVKGEGKPILLIPGLGCAGSVWSQVTDALQDGFECHVLTLPGFAGQKPIAPEDGFLPAVKKEIIRYIKNELNEETVIIGHSLGGFLGLSIASEPIDGISGLIIVDSYPFMPAAMNPNATEANMAPQAALMKQMMLSTPDSIFALQQKMVMETMISDPQHIKRALRWSLDSDRETLAQSMYELMTTDLRDSLQSIKIPILVLGSWYAARDYGVTKEMIHTTYENQYSQADQCQIIIADTARHFIMLDAPGWFLDEVKSFIRP